MFSFRGVLLLHDDGAFVAFLTNFFCYPAVFFSPSLATNSFSAASY